MAFSIQNPRVRVFMNVYGLDESTAFMLAEAEEKTGKTAKINSGYRNLDKEQKLWDSAFEKYVGDEGFSSEVEDAIKSGNMKSRKSDNISSAIKRVKAAGGGKSAIKALKLFRQNKAAVGHSKHSQTRNTMDLAKTADNKEIKKYLEKNYNFKEHKEYDKSGKLRNLHHMEKGESGESLADLSKMSDTNTIVSSLADLKKSQDTKPKSFKETFDEAYEANPGGIFDWEGKKFKAVKKGEELPTIDRSPAADISGLMSKYKQLKELPPVELPFIGEHVERPLTEADMNPVEDMPTPEEMNPSPADSPYSGFEQDQLSNMMDFVNKNREKKFAEGGTVGNLNIDELLRRKLEEEEAAKLAAEMPSPAEMNPIEPVREPAQELAPPVVEAPTVEAPKAPQFDSKGEMQGLLQRYKDLQKAPQGEVSNWSKLSDVGAHLGNLGTRLDPGAAQLKFKAGAVAADRAAMDKSRAGNLKNMKAQMDVLKEMTGSSSTGRNVWRLTTLENDEGKATTYRVNTKTGEKQEVGKRGFAPAFVKDPKTGKLINRLSGEFAKFDDKEEKTYNKYIDMDPEERKFVEGKLKDYTKDIADVDDFEETLQNLGQFVGENLDGTIGAIKRQLARTVGQEKGVMTDADVAAFGGTDKVLSMIAQFAHAKSKGGMTKEIQDNFNAILKVATKSASRKRSIVQNRYVNPIKFRLGDEANDEFIHKILGIKAPKKSKGNSRKIESRISGFMKKNNLSREKAINILKSKGLL